MVYKKQMGAESFLSGIQFGQGFTRLRPPMES
jgi:hypothetical protein